MRFELKLKIKATKKAGLPINYQYPLSSWIYRVFAQADEEFAAKLHDFGFTDGLRNFKLFTFSRLFIQGARPAPQNRLQFASAYAKFYISFQIRELHDNFILGLFRNQQGEIADRFGGIAFEVEEIRRVDPIPILPQMQFRSISPIFVDYHEEGERYPRHLSHQDAEYEDMLFESLCNKYDSVRNQKVARDLFHRKSFGLEVKEKLPIRKRLVTIKEGSSEATKRKAYDFTMQVKAPEPLMELIINTGLGRNNSQGFGMVEVFENS